MGNPNSHKKVLILCGDFMEDYEVMVPFQALQAYGVSVDTVCPCRKAGEVCRTVLQYFAGYQTYSEFPGHNFTLNATFDEIEASQYDGLLIQGGRASEYLVNYESVVDLVKQFHKSAKPIAAICHGQLILAAAGVVQGLTCTGYPAVKSVLITHGGHWVEPTGLDTCTVDGNVITGVSYEGHKEYIQHFIKGLGGTVTGSDKRILFLCGDYTEDLMVTVPFQSLQILGCHVDSVCPNKKAGDKCITAIHVFERDEDQTYSEKAGHNFTITADFEGLDASCYDALVIPGGRAPEYLALDDNVIKLVKQFMQSGKPVASVGHGQQILSAADLLKGKKCTACHAVKLHLVSAGATWLEPDPINLSVSDKNLVTTASWQGHPEFISQLMTLLGIQISF